MSELDWRGAGAVNSKLASDEGVRIMRDRGSQLVILESLPYQRGFRGKDSGM
jgi:hypothetical protein